MSSSQFKTISSNTRQANIQQNMEAFHNFFVQVASGTFQVKLEPEVTNERRRRGSKSSTPKPASTPRITRRRKHDQAFSGSPQSSAAPSPTSFLPYQPQTIAPQQFMYPNGVPYYPQQQPSYHVPQQTPNSIYYQIQDMNTNKIIVRQPLRDVKNVEALEQQMGSAQEHSKVGMVPFPSQQFYYMPVPMYPQQNGGGAVPVYFMPGMDGSNMGHQGGQFIVNGAQFYHPQQMPFYVNQVQDATSFQQQQMQTPVSTTSDIKNQSVAPVISSPVISSHTVSSHTVSSPTVSSPDSVKEELPQLHDATDQTIPIEDPRLNELNLPDQVDFYNAYLFD